MIGDEILTYLSHQKIKYRVYALTAFVTAIFGVSWFLLSLTETLPETALPFDTKRVWISAKVKIIEEEQEFVAPIEPIPGVFALRLPKFTTKTVRRTFYRLDLRYPVDIYEEDTGEISIVASKTSKYPLAIEPRPNIIQIKFLSSKSLIFMPDTVTIPFHRPNPHLAYFESERVTKPVDKKVLIQGRLISSDSIKKTDLNNIKVPFKDLGIMEIRINPKEIIFGMSESTLKGINMLSGALGIPAILLSIITFMITRIALKGNVKEDKHSRIIIPGEEGHRRTKRSSRHGKPRG